MSCRLIPKALDTARLFLVAVVFAGSSCDQPPSPVSPEHASYIGTWQHGEFEEHFSRGGTYIFLRIPEDGYFVYARSEIKGSITTCRYLNSSPIKNQTDNEIEVSVFWLFSTTFEVNEPPGLVRYEWRMKIDGHELIKTDGEQTGAKYQWGCSDGKLASQ
jgi:hypothetical protein